MATHMELVEKVNELLLANEPDNISVDTHTGYTGYAPQAIVDAMNKVFGLGQWGVEELSSEDKEGLVVAKIEVWIAGVDFRPKAWGQNKITRGDIGDARKGAGTDGMKKALSYFSVGNRAYLGLLEDPKKSNNQQRQNTTKPAQQATNTASRPQNQQVPAKPVEQASAQSNPQAKPIASIPTFNGVRNAAIKHLDEQTFEQALKDFMRDKNLKPDHEFTPDDVLALQQVLLPMIKEARKAS